MKCPACFNELTEFKFGGVLVDACAGGCAGIWFDAFELQKVDEQHEVPGEHLLHVQRDPNLQVDFSRRRDCPRCDGIKLQRHFFSAKKQVEVDQCPNCGGYWLDEGELEKIRAEKSLTARTTAASSAGLSMEAIRFLYRQKLEQRPPP
ncbi:MAG: zf-TFIIB domain-containing protein [Verrucomicrobiota bacterium]